MDLIVTHSERGEYVIPQTALDTQYKVHKGKILAVRPATEPVKTQELPSAVEEKKERGELTPLKKTQELQNFAIKNNIPPAVWKDAKHPATLKKNIREWLQNH